MVRGGTGVVVHSIQMHTAVTIHTRKCTRVNVAREKKAATCLLV